MSIITIREVAKIAGVSVSTVSRVLNDMPDVNAETKKRVTKVIDEHGYVPNFNARTLKQSRTNIICIVVKGIQNPFFAPIVEGIQFEIDKTIYIPLVHYIDESDDEVKTAATLVTEKKALGIIFLGGTPSSKAKAISKLKVPCVLATMSAQGLEIKNASSVCVDDFRSAKMAIDYLIDNGHKRIAIVGGLRLGKDNIWNRYTGAKASFAEHGLEFDEDLYIDSKFTFEDAYAVTTKALTKGQKKFTAIFAMSDIMAIGATKAIYDRRMKVPEDISVIGFDGTKMANYYNPTITTVRQPSEEIARRSAELIIQNIKGENIGMNIVLDTEIVVGASVKKCF
ncbi:MAG: LacI family DNA-binding transcriptional regulator [Saccharofermentanales bacterium]